MTKRTRFFISFLLIGFMIQVEAQQPSYGYQANENMGYSPTPQTNVPFEQQSYGRKIGKKALSGWTNLSLGLLEIPKNIINVTNESNVFYGFIGGTFKGALNMGGRMAVGVADLLTFPIPTKPIAYPLFIWDDFDVDTTYGPVFRLGESTPANLPVEPMPVVQTVAPPVVETPAPVDRSRLYNEQTNQTLDRVFKKEMMK